MEQEENNKMTEVKGSNQVAPVNSKTIATINAISENKDLIKDAFSLCQNIQNNRSQIKSLEIQSRERIEVMTQKVQLARDVLTAVFSERQSSLNSHYAVLDKALQSDDKDLIIESLRGISKIVAESPLDNFDKFLSVWDNKDETLLLDF